MAVNIVIAGAGDMGYHLAEHLSFENKNITVIDVDKDLLDNAAAELDVLTVLGDSASLGILAKANAGQADMVMAETTSEDNNLLTAMLVKLIVENMVR